MSRIIFVVLVFIFSAHSSISQSKVFGESGAIWKFTAYTQVGPMIYEVKYDKDATILGKNCEVFRTTLHKFTHSPNGSSSYGGTSIVEDHSIYMNEDTVFFYNNGQFRVLYNFNARIGDTWNLGYDTNGGFNCEEAIVRVLDTGHSTINGHNLRYIEVEMTEERAVFVIYGRIYEKLIRINDSINSSDYPFPTEGDLCHGILELPYIRFKCYKDDYFPLFTKTYPGQEENLWLDDCDINIYVGGEEIGVKDDRVKVYPNPFTDNLTIQATNDSKEYGVLMLDQMGKTVLSRKLVMNDTEVTTENLTPGTYYLVIKQGDTRIHFEKVVKH